MVFLKTYPIVFFKKHTYYIKEVKLKLVTKQDSALHIIFRILRLHDTLNHEVYILDIVPHGSPR